VFDLSQVVDVVAGHGFDDGPEGHGASLRVGGWAVAVVLRDGSEKEQVPMAGGLEERERGIEIVGGVTFGPEILIERLDDGVGLAGRGGEGLAETEGEDDFAVGEVRGDLADAPLVGGRLGDDLGAGKAGGDGVETLGRRGQDGDGVLAVKITGVGV